MIRRAGLLAFVTTLATASALVTSACAPGGSLDEAVCPEEGTELTYENFGKRFMERHCNYCHGEAVVDRHGAPSDEIFDDHESIVEHAEHIYARSAGDNDSMPPGPEDPPIEERDQLAEWLACGAP